VNKLRALQPSDWLIVAGGVIVLVFGVARWFSWDATSANVVIADQTSNAFDYLVTGVIPWLLVVGAAAVTLLLATEALNRGNVPWPLVMLAATLLAFVLILIRLIVGIDPDVEGADVDVEVSRGIGIWFSAFGALVALAGAFIGFRNLGVDAQYKPVDGRSATDPQISPPGDPGAP
jgi:hypothetical protein